MGLFRLLASIGATAWAYSDDKAKRRKASERYYYEINTKDNLIAKYCDFRIEKQLAQISLSDSEMGKYPCKWFGMDKAPNPFIGEKIYNLLLEYRDKFPEFISGFYGGTDGCFSWYNLEDLREAFVEKSGKGVCVYNLSWNRERAEASILCMVMMLCGKIPSAEALSLALTYTEMHESSTCCEGRQYDRARFLLKNPEIPSLIDPEEFYEELRRTDIMDKFVLEVGCDGYMYRSTDQATCRKYYLQTIELMNCYDIHSIKDLKNICAKHIPYLESDSPMDKRERRRELVTMIREYDETLCITSYPCHPIVRATFAFMRLLADSDKSRNFAYFGRSCFDQSELSVNISHFRSDLVYKNAMLIDVVERRMKTLHIKGGIDTLLDCIKYNKQQLITAFMHMAEKKHNPFFTVDRLGNHGRLSAEFPIIYHNDEPVWELSVEPAYNHGADTEPTQQKTEPESPLVAQTVEPTKQAKSFDPDEEFARNLCIPSKVDEELSRKTFEEVKDIASKYGINNTFEFQSAVMTCFPKESYYIGEAHFIIGIFGFESTLYTLLATHKFHPLICFTVAMVLSMSADSFSSKCGFNSKTFDDGEYTRMNYGVGVYLSCMDAKRRCAFEAGVVGNPFAFYVIRHRGSSLGLGTNPNDILTHMIALLKERPAELIEAITFERGLGRGQCDKIHIYDRIKNCSLPIYPDGAPLTVEEYEKSHGKNL